jgi:hypothetical protein
MVLLNLFPTGVLQFIDTVQNGYWHARVAADSGFKIQDSGFKTTDEQGRRIAVILNLEPCILNPSSCEHDHVHVSLPHLQHRQQCCALPAATPAATAPGRPASAETRRRVRS